VEEILKGNEGKTFEFKENLSGFDELAYVQGKTFDLDWDCIKKLFQRVDKKITMSNAQSVGLITQQGVKEYPLIALREAIINAIVHADYSMKGVYISIAIFDDRIEITNPGGLP